MRGRRQRHDEPVGSCFGCGDHRHGLASGLFYTFACSVMIGLGQTGDRTFVDAMQRINGAILNVWFAASFGGALVLTAIAAALTLGVDG